MRPLSQLGEAEARGLFGVAFDLDDTVLTKGELTEDAYRALFAMKRSGLRLLAVTGRPSAWGELVARQWPVDGCIAENGAIYTYRDQGHLSRLDQEPEAERRSRRIRLSQIVVAAREAVPEARLTDDMDGRISDVTWDIGERTRLPEDRIQALLAVIVAHGARWSRSSVHAHATFDTVDKASGIVRFCHLRFGEDASRTLARLAFVGDSGNDAPCFAAFRTTVGVANVKNHLAHLTVPPRYVATRAMGEGFAELAAHLTRLRG
jgi:HAD superfamily hydrolase (TIGR01484 family)